MSDGDRNLRLALRLLGGFLIALAIGAVTIGWRYGLEQEAIYEKSAREGRASYAKYACDEGAKANGTRSSVEASNSKPCASSERAKQENDNRRDYANLVAQQSSALWAKVMGVAALIGMGLSGAGVILVWTTFRETRKANEIAENAHRRQSRAYVAIMGMSLDKAVSMGQIPKATVRFKNTGQTPALNVRTSGWMALQKPDDTSMPPDLMTWSGGITMSGSGGDLHASPMMDRPITEEECTKLVAKQLRLTVFAVCIYEDIFGGIHHLVATGAPKDPINDVGMSPCSFGNYTSDDKNRLQN